MAGTMAFVRSKGDQDAAGASAPKWRRVFTEVTVLLVLANAFAYFRLMTLI